jgi:hypothetical protein
MVSQHLKNLHESILNKLGELATHDFNTDFDIEGDLRSFREHRARKLRHES